MSEQPFNSTGYQAFLSEGRLMGTRCRLCGSIFLPPRAICPADYTSEMEWIELSGRGKLAAFSIIYVGTPAMAAEGFSRQRPYCSGVIELEEGPKISAQVIDLDVFHPDKIKIGMPLEAVFVKRSTEEETVLGFSPRKLKHSE